MKSPQKGEKVDSITYYSNNLERLNEKVDRMQKEAIDAVAEGNNTQIATEWIANVITKTTGAATSSLVRLYRMFKKFCRNIIHGDSNNDSVEQWK
jgi:hypothetical protein